jgi:integrase
LGTLVRLTEKFLQGVKAERRRDLSIDGRRGLLLRLSLNRGQTTRTFRFRHFHNGVARYTTLGDYPALTLADAHDLHGRCVTAVKTGSDPQAVVDAYWAARAPRPTAASGPTVADVIKEFLAVAERQRKRPEQAKYLLETCVRPKLGDTPVASLRKRDIVEMLEPIVRIGSLVLANRVQQVLKQAFAVAADRDLISSAPVFPRALVGGEESVRTRVLAESEIRDLWAGLDKLSTGDEAEILRPLALALKLQLVTAQRRGEIAAARWSDVTEETWPITATDGKPVDTLVRVWRIPDTKSDRPHEIALSPLATRRAGGSSRRLEVRAAERAHGEGRDGSRPLDLQGSA